MSAVLSFRNGIRSLVFLVPLCACTEEGSAFDIEANDCTVEGEKDFVLRAMQDYYLWSSELPEVSLEDYETAEELLSDLRYSERDRWSRISKKSTADALYQEGKFIGYGYRTRTDKDGNYYVSFVFEGSSAKEQDMKRGDRLVKIGGYDIAEVKEENLWSMLYGPSEPGPQVTLTLEGSDGEEREVELVKGWIDIVTVPFVDIFDTDAGPVGYLFFDRFVKDALPDLDAAFAGFKDAGAKKVIIDLRYNGGGLISVARHLQNLFAGSEYDGEVAYKTVHNETLSDENQIRNFSSLDDSLDTEEVTFLTTSATLSASELVINSLRPWIDVRLVGDETGGKPVGSRGFDFCEKVIYPVTFKFENAESSSEYFDGFTPNCQIEDDFSHDLGTRDEAMLSTALGLIEGESCEEMRAKHPGLRPLSRELPLPPKPTSPRPGNAFRYRAARSSVSARKNHKEREPITFRLPLLVGVFLMEVLGTPPSLRAPLSAAADPRRCCRRRWQS